MELGRSNTQVPSVRVYGSGFFLLDSYLSIIEKR